MYSPIVKAQFYVTGIEQRSIVLRLAKPDYTIQSGANYIICHMQEKNLEFVEKKLKCKVTVLSPPPPR